MKKGYTHLSFVLDNSGSMLRRRNDTIGGFNSFLSKQKTQPGEMTFSLYQFLLDASAGPNNPLYNKVEPAALVLPYTNFPKTLAVKTIFEFAPLSLIPDLSEANYACDTGTPLLDTIGYSVHRTGELLAQKNEQNRPDTVLFVILTDGEEIDSRSYTKPKINEMIKHQTEVYKWDFIFLGANQDAIQAGTSLGISALSSMNYSASPAGVVSTYDSLVDVVSTKRMLGANFKAAFSDVQRSAAMSDDDKGS